MDLSGANSPSWDFLVAVPCANWCTQCCGKIWGEGGGKMRIMRMDGAAERCICIPKQKIYIVGSFKVKGTF